MLIEMALWWCINSCSEAWYKVQSSLHGKLVWEVNSIPLSQDVGSTVRRVEVSGSKWNCLENQLRSDPRNNILFYLM